ncbi:hypothetical protein [Roseovarius sp. Pro17]|nr:hypothetical protein [Roseovarius sp. Pro17]
MEIRQAANDSGNRLRFQAGADAVGLLDKRKVQDDATFISGIKALMKD